MAKLLRLAMACMLFVLTIFLPLKKLVAAAPLRVEVLSVNDFGVKTTHGTAFIYNRWGAALEHEGEVLRPIMELPFRVDQPELLRKPPASVLQIIVREFERLGYGVQELHLDIGGCTVVHFIG